MINTELESYTVNLLRKPQLIAANKMDMLGPDSDEYGAFRDEAEALGFKVFPISAATRSGVSELMKAAVGELARIETELREEAGGVPAYLDIMRPEDDPHYRDVLIRKDGAVYELSGQQLLKIFNSTNFNDMGSVRYLYKHLEKCGAAERLKSMGLCDGDTVKIYDFEFVWYDE
jgi:GTP-binding protein